MNKITSKGEYILQIKVLKCIILLAIVYVMNPMIQKNVQAVDAFRFVMAFAEDSLSDFAFFSNALFVGVLFVSAQCTLYF